MVPGEKAGMASVFISICHCASHPCCCTEQDKFEFKTTEGQTHLSITGSTIAVTGISKTNTTAHDHTYSVNLNIVLTEVVLPGCSFLRPEEKPIAAIDPLCYEHFVDEEDDDISFYGCSELTNEM